MLDRLPEVFDKNLYFEPTSFIRDSESDVFKSGRKLIPVFPGSGRLILHTGYPPSAARCQNIGAALWGLSNITYILLI